jgi:Ser/Thr protein kinase RdoA (MazF antagonist)
VVLADGRRVFLKACGSEINPDTPDLNGAEVAALRVLPEDVLAPRLVTSHDGGEWVALVMEDVERRRPGVPWTDSDVAAVSTSLERAASACGADALPAFADIVHALTAWDEAAADPADGPHRLFARLPEMLDLQARAREVTRGESLVHWDARSDNVLIRPDGEAVLLDERGPRPAPPGLPTIPAWQARCATASLEWLEEGTQWT